MREFIFVFILLLFSTKQVLAVSISILSYASSIGEESFTVTTKIEGAETGTNYLRIDLYQDKEGSKSYFGETDNGQSWYGGTDGKQYFSVPIITGNPTIATVSGRIGDPSISEYPGPGAYKLRIRRYTSSGGAGSGDCIPVDINITKTWPSSSPSPSPSIIPTPSPTQTPTPTPTSTPKPSLKPSIRPSPSPTLPAEALSEGEEGTVAGISTDINLSSFGISPSPSAQMSLQGDSSQALTLNTDRLKTVLMIGSGLVLISLAGFLGYRRYLDTIAK